VLRQDSADEALVRMMMVGVFENAGSKVFEAANETLVIFASGRSPTSRCGSSTMALLLPENAWRGGIVPVRLPRITAAGNYHGQACQGLPCVASLPGPDSP
jgi:hypothetical protein